ncbi:MAG TPA: YaiI/YqxD family protein [Gemmatimonadales bacterium]|nr:YaiI/YqxD family protein [Gemmatimonadales bacterium]
MPATLRMRRRPPSHPTTTSTPASANSPASMRPVGPPPAITTECVITATPGRSDAPISRCARALPQASGSWIYVGGRGGELRERDLKIWIDADAAPREVKELVFRAAKRLTIETVLVANQRLQTPAGNPLVSAVWVDGGADVADQHIASHAAAGDLVVTQDVPLAAMLVPKGVAVLDPRGEEHTAETVGERLSVRDFMEQARIAGLVTGGPAPYDARAKQAFAAALDRVLTRLRRSG